MNIVYVLINVYDLHVVFGWFQSVLVGRVASLERSPPSPSQKSPSQNPEMSKLRQASLDLEKQVTVFISPVEYTNILVKTGQNSYSLTRCTVR